MDMRGDHPHPWSPDSDPPTDYRRHRSTRRLIRRAVRTRDHAHRPRTHLVTPQQASQLAGHRQACTRADVMVWYLDLLAEIKRLDPLQQRLIWLSVVEDHNHTAAAAACRISRSTAHALLLDAYRQLEATEPFTAAWERGQ